MPRTGRTVLEPDDRFAVEPPVHCRCRIRPVGTRHQKKPQRCFLSRTMARLISANAFWQVGQRAANASSDLARSTCLRRETCQPQSLPNGEVVDPRRRRSHGSRGNSAPGTLLWSWHRRRRQRRAREWARTSPRPCGILCRHFAWRACSSKNRRTPSHDDGGGLVRGISGHIAPYQKSSGTHGAPLEP